MQREGTTIPSHSNLVENPIVKLVKWCPICTIGSHEICYILPIVKLWTNLQIKFIFHMFIRRILNPQQLFERQCQRQISSHYTCTYNITVRFVFNLNCMRETLLHGSIGSSTDKASAFNCSKSTGLSISVSSSKETLNGISIEFVSSSGCSCVINWFAYTHFFICRSNCVFWPNLSWQAAQW